MARNKVEVPHIARFMGRCMVGSIGTVGIAPSVHQVRGAFSIHTKQGQSLKLFFMISIWVRVLLDWWVSDLVSPAILSMHGLYTQAF